MLSWTEDAINNLLDIAEASLTSSVKKMKLATKVHA